jgi:hypothetical protein
MPEDLFDVTDNLRLVWPEICALHKYTISTSTCERRLELLPVVDLTSACTASKGFTVASIIQVVQRVVATPCDRELLVQLPIRGQPVREFAHTKRFSDLHRQMQIASIRTTDSCFFVGDLITFRHTDTRVLYGKIREIYTSNGHIFAEVHRAMNFFQLQVELRDGLDTPDSTDGKVNMLLRWVDSNTPELISITEDCLLHCIPRNQTCLVGHVRRVLDTFNVTAATETEKRQYAWIHPAVKFARESNLDIIMAPISLFSDETSGNVSKQFNKYESCSITFSSMPRETRAKNEHSYIISTSNGLPAMDQLDSIYTDLAKLENGIIGIDGMTSKQVIIVSPIAAFLGDNPRQSDVCSHRGMSTHANCRMCTRKRPQQIWQLAPQRTRSFVRRMRTEIAYLLTSNVDRNVKDGKILQRKTGVQCIVNRILDLKFVNPMIHTPIELLHTALLGIARYLVEELQKTI